MLVDREAERQELDDLLACVREGLSGVVVVRGEAGIGKTTLLDYAVASAADMQMVGRWGSSPKWSSVLRPSISCWFRSLAGSSRYLARSARRSARRLGWPRAFPLDIFLVGLAVLTLLADAARERPLLCVVDDGQWLDQASADVLAFVARRLFADRIGMVFAVREPAERRVAFEGLPELRLGGLSDEDARELLASVAAGRLDQRIRRSDHPGNARESIGAGRAGQRNRGGGLGRLASGGAAAARSPARGAFPSPHNDAAAGHPDAAVARCGRTVGRSGAAMARRRAPWCRTRRGGASRHRSAGVVRTGRCVSPPL